MLASERRQLKRRTVRYDLLAMAMLDRVGARNFDIRGHPRIGINTNRKNVVIGDERLTLNIG